MRGTVSICPSSAWASPRPMVDTGPRRSDGSKTTRPRRAPTRAAPASRSSWSASSSVLVLASRSVSSCSVVRSEIQPASRSWMKAPGAEGTSDRDPAVCAETGTVGSIPATFGRCGALMAADFPTSAFRRIASQTPMSFCVAIRASACTRAPHVHAQVRRCPALSPRDLWCQSGRQVGQKTHPWVTIYGRLGVLEQGCSRGEVPEERHFGHAGYVIDEGQGQFRSPRNPAAGPDVLSSDGHAPTPEWRGLHLGSAGATCALPLAALVRTCRSGPVSHLLDSARPMLGTDDPPVPQIRRACTHSEVMITYSNSHVV